MLTPPDGTVTINEGRAITSLRVTNHADRPIQVRECIFECIYLMYIPYMHATPKEGKHTPTTPHQPTDPPTTPQKNKQVGSHYHFIETNPYLAFDRKRAYGRRLNLLAGTAVRFEPGETKTVALVGIAGHRVVRGGNGLCDGPVDGGRVDGVVASLVARGFRHVVEEEGAGEEEEEGLEGGREAKRAKTGVSSITYVFVCVYVFLFLFLCVCGGRHTHISKHKRHPHTQLPRHSITYTAQQRPPLPPTRIYINKTRTNTLTPTQTHTHTHRTHHSDPLVVSREHYANIYGPGLGDIVRLGDTDLYIRGTSLDSILYMYKAIVCCIY